MERKPIQISKGSFFKQAKEYDVLFLGTSHMKNAVYPMELWQDYGIVSYNLGIPGSQMARNYWTMENALDYAKPKLVVMDVSAIWKNIKMDEVDSVHRNLDFYPMSYTKWRAIDDLFTPDERDSKSYDYQQRKWEFVCNLLVYHNRWTELKKLDFDYEQNPEKGGGLFLDIADEVEYSLVSQEEMTPKETISTEYLCRTIEECQAEGIEVLLTYMPSSINEDIQKSVNSVELIAEKYNVNFLNFMYAEDLLDYTTDFHDMNHTGGHLNPSGARKLTSYLGEYIVNHYEIADERQNQDFAHWHQDYSDYTEYKINTMKSAKSIYQYFCMLPDQRLDVIIYMKENSKIRNDKKISAVIQNIATEMGNTSILEQKAEGDYLLVAARGDGVRYEIDDLSQGIELETKFAELSAGKEENGLPYLYINQEGENLFSGKWENVEDAPDIQIVCIDHITGKVVDVRGYKKEGSTYKKTKSTVNTEPSFEVTEIED